MYVRCCAWDSCTTYIEIYLSRTQQVEGSMKPIGEYMGVCFYMCFIRIVVYTSNNSNELDLVFSRHIIALTRCRRIASPRFAASNHKTTFESTSEY